MCGADVNVMTQVRTPARIAELLGEITLNSDISVIGFTDSGSTSYISTNYVLDTTNGEYNSDYVTADGAYMLKTDYKYTSTEQTVDSGKMCSVSIDYTGLTVESVVIK